MPYIIDAHQDLAYNACSFQRDLLKSAEETRQLEASTKTPERNGHTLLGWPDYQRGQVALVFGTLFLSPKRYSSASWETQVYADASQAYVLYNQQLDYYRRLCDDHPDQFRMVLSQKDLQSVLSAWESQPAHLPVELDGNPENEQTRPTVTHPVGILLLMEGAEGVRSPRDMEYWFEMGVRAAGPVWAGTRFCGGMYEPGDFTSEGLDLMEVMAGLGYTLDISHMNEVSALQALDRYEGPVAATHANARALLKGGEGERHLTDRTIRRLVERDGIMGVVPFNNFLLPGWSLSDGRHLITLRSLVAHIDHVCQIAGDDRHVGLGTDFDGGFGWPSVPQEINTIADMQKLVPILAEYGYSESSIASILGGNWRQHLERSLPVT
jgi:membrane dipeptidase